MLKRLGDYRRGVEMKTNVVSPLMRSREARRIKWPFKVNFTNERGLDISIRAGVWPSLWSDGGEHVYIGIEWPDSLSENTLTRIEAERLRDALIAILAPNPALS